MIKTVINISQLDVGYYLSKHTRFCTSNNAECQLKLLLKCNTINIDNNMDIAESL